MKHNRKILIFLLFPALFAGKAVWADHISEDLMMEVYQALMGPVCQDSNQKNGTSQDCENPDPVLFKCWHDKFHMYYDQAGLEAFLGEIKASNEKYPYFNEPYYNEFFSGRNWDNAMDFSMDCGS